MKKIEPTWLTGRMVFWSCKISASTCVKLTMLVAADALLL